MNIFENNHKGGPYETIKDYMKRSLLSKEYELELIYGSHPRNTLKKIEFLKVLNFLKQTYELEGETNNLDIKLQNVRVDKVNFDNIRCTINGVQNIKKYCKTNSLVDIPNLVFIRKESNKDSKNPSIKYGQIKNTDFDFRINLKKEVVLDESDEQIIKFKDNLKDGLKYYRYKKRYSFITSDRLYRIDLTAVKSNTYNPKRKTYNLYKNLVDSGILMGKEIYELEIEYIGYQKHNFKFPIEEFSKKVFSEWDKDTLSDEDYQKQLELTSYKPGISFTSGVSFSPDDSFTPDESFAPENIFTPDDTFSMNSGYEFITDVQSFEYTPETDVITQPKNTMNTNWAKAAGLKGNPMDNIWLNYWHDRGNWIFLIIVKKNKKLLFDGVLENYTDSYEDAPKNANYVKYIIHPPLTNEEIDEIKENQKPDHEISSYGKYEEDFDNRVNVPFDYITGLRKEEENLFQSAGALPSWAPKGGKTLDKDNRFIDVVNLKLNEVITRLLTVIKGKNLIVSQRKCNEILEEYKTLTEQNTDKVNFVGPNPVSMSLDGLNVENPHNILQGYVVTEKADGIRAQLFIDKKGECWLITQKKEIIYTGSRVANNSLFGSCILDGEYIQKDRNNKAIELFMIFDIYYSENGEYPNHPHTLPWIGKKKSDICRSHILGDFKQKIEIVNSSLSSLRDGVYSYSWSKDMKNIDSKDSIRIGYKKYYEGPKTLKKDKKDPTVYTNEKGICKVSKKILDLDKINGYEYNIDGLIYLPMFYSVTSSSDSFVKDSINGTWNENYKWKPPEENTIDFKIKFVKEEIKGKKVDKITSFKKDKKTIKCQQVHLYVGYDINKDDMTDFTWKVMGNDNRKKTEILFNPSCEKDSIHICNIPLIKNKLICLKDKTQVQDGFIYEMRYEPNNPFGYQWVPLRIRDDKIRPNNSDTADNVWKTIKYPVTEDMIKGKEDYKQAIIDSKVISGDTEKEHQYYMDYTNELESDNILREFHNYLKDKLINSVLSINTKPKSVLDTSIGRGGDIGKYLRNDTSNISFLMGLDISPDVNKAAKRYYLKNDTPKALFMQYDTSMSIMDGTGCVGDHKDRNRLLIDILYDRQKSLPKELRPLTGKYKGLCKKGFDLISSQFTIHYYFKDENTLRTYIKNISDNLKKGGHFIGTCYDGMKVFSKLKDLENGYLEMIDDFGNKVYSIRKNYQVDDFSYKKDEIEKLFGNEINVYMSSIGKEFPEYLVNFEIFINIMKEYDLVLDTPNFNKDYKGLLDNKSYQYTDGFGGFEMIINDLDKLYSKDLSLKKYFPQSFGLIKPENKLLKELSELNNWFIFKKL